MEGLFYTSESWFAFWWFTVSQTQLSESCFLSRIRTTLIINGKVLQLRSSDHKVSFRKQNQHNEGKKIHFHYDKCQKKQKSGHFFISIRHNDLVDPTTNQSAGAKCQEDFYYGRKMALSNHKDFPMCALSVSQRLQNATQYPLAVIMIFIWLNVISGTAGWLLLWLLECFYSENNISNETMDAGKISRLRNALVFSLMLEQQM